MREKDEGLGSRVVVRAVRRRAEEMVAETSRRTSSKVEATNSLVFNEPINVQLVAHSSTLKLLDSEPSMMASDPVVRSVWRESLVRRLRDGLNFCHARR